MNTVSIDIGGTNFRIGVFDENGTRLKFEKMPVRNTFYSGDVLKDLERKIKSFCDGFSFAAVSIGFPATLNVERTRVIQAPNVPFMENLPVCEELSDAFKVPVFAERDVTFALCYDLEKFSISDTGIVCGIYFGTGIGNAIAIDGNPVAGAHGTAGELGHIPVAGCGIECGCGNKGCLEAVAGGKALSSLQGRLYPDTPIGRIFSLHAGDGALKEYVDMMAIAVATEVNILDPACVLLGGGVLEMEGFPKDFLTERILARTRKPLPAKELRLVYTGDPPDKNVVGGVYYAQKRMNLT